MKFQNETSQVLWVASGVCIVVFVLSLVFVIPCYVACQYKNCSKCYTPLSVTGSGLVFAFLAAIVYSSVSKRHNAIEGLAIISSSENGINMTNTEPIPSAPGIREVTIVEFTPISVIANDVLPSYEEAVNYPVPNWTYGSQIWI